MISMINVSEQLKDILKNDRFPMSDTSIPKDLEITFDGMAPIHADQVVDDSFSLTESIIADDDIRFGTCRASQIKFKLANVPEDLKGREFTINQLIGDEYIIPLGKYKVQSAKLQDDLIFKEVIAYDKLKDTDVDVSSWYNGLFPTGNETYTLKQFRSSLLAHLGIEEVLQTLPNDDMIVEKTIDPTQISGRTVLEATVELNGAFGNINRYGKFRRIILQPGYGDYPTDDYPQMDYPVSETDTSYLNDNLIDETIGKSMYKSVRFEEYTVKEINKLQIRAEENDIGAIVGTGTNTYVIEGNFLVFGKSSSELERIAINIYGYIAKRPYRPYETENIGLPYIEVGDSLEYATDDVVHGYVLHRTLTGVQSLWDEIEAPGSEEREQNFGVNKEIIQLQGKVTRIRKDVEGVSIEVEDLEQDTASKFTQTAQSISAEVTRAKESEGALSGSIDILAGQVVLKVDTNGNIGYIDLMGDPDTGLTSINIKTDNIDLTGYVSITSLKTPGSVEIDGGNLKAGTVIADGVTAEWVYAGDIRADQIYGGTITGVKIISSGQYGTVTLDNGGLIGDYVYATAGGFGSVSVGNVSITSSNVSTPSINGYTPITSGNIGSQSVNYASSADLANDSLRAVNATSASNANDAYNAQYLRYLVYVSSNDNLRPASSGGSSCGTSDGKWSSVYAINGTIQTSDERKKMDILPLCEKYLRFARMVAPYTYKMIEGTSGRRHVGFIAQRIEEAMTECEISDMEFAGLIKAPVYAKKLKDKDGKEINEYDTSSEIIDYDYSLRYDEFIPLIFAWLRDIETRVLYL